MGSTESKIIDEVKKFLEAKLHNAKIKRAKEKAEASRLYYEGMEDAYGYVLRFIENTEHEEAKTPPANGDSSVSPKGLPGSV